MPIPKDIGFFPPKPVITSQPQVFVPPPPLPPPPPVRTSWFGDGFTSAPAKGSMPKLDLLGGGAPKLDLLSGKSGAGALLKVDPQWPAGPLEPSQTPSEDVSMMQERLVELGYMTQEQMSGGPGVYGTNTTNAVYEFQLANGIIPPTGIADRATLQAMGSANAVSSEAYFEGLSGETVISPSIGAAGPAPVPTLETLQQGPLTGTINSSAAVNVRPDPSTSGDPVGQLASGSTVTIVEPQPPIPQGGDPGWVYVSGTGTDGQPVEGWVANGYQGTDLVRENTRSGDPRVQDRMEAMGYVPPDGVVDEKAIANFQRMNGLEPTGQLDDQTLSAMWSADAKISTHLRQVKDATYNHSSDAPSRSNNCGPTSVAMALAAVGLRPIDNADPQASIDEARAAAGGTSSDKTGPGDLEDAIRDGGGEPYRVTTMEQVQMAVTQGDPVVLFGYTAEAGGGHWVTVLGYDPSTGTYLVSDPLSRDGVATWTQEQMNTYVDFSVDSVAVHNPNG